MKCDQTPTGTKCDGEMKIAKKVYQNNKCRAAYKCDKCGRVVWGSAQ